MAIFGGKDKKEKTESKKTTDSKKSSKNTSANSTQKVDQSVLTIPRITEKAAFASDNNVYVFNVNKSANKKEISKAVEDVYKVTPLKVRTAKIPAKRVFVRGRWGVKKGGKKAYVYLDKKDKIEII